MLTGKPVIHKSLRSSRSNRAPRLVLPSAPSPKFGHVMGHLAGGYREPAVVVLPVGIAPGDALFLRCANQAVGSLLERPFDMSSTV